MFSSIGIPEILVILTAVLILFGGRKIPQLARDLGTGIREFKRSLTNAKDGLELEESTHILNEEQSIARSSPKRMRGKAGKASKARKAKKKVKKST